MSDIVKGLKNVWMKSMEAIGDTASNIASNTKYKVQEMNLINRRHEILSDFGSQAYALWQQGVQFPEELQQQLAELSKVDETLNAIRAERLAYLQTMEEERNARAAAEADSRDFVPDDADDDASADETEADVTDEVPVMEVPDDEDAEITGDEIAQHDVPTLEIPNEDDDPAEKNTDALYEDAIEQLMAEDAPAAPEMQAWETAEPTDFEKKVSRALDTMQDKVSRLGKVIDRSVQNLAKVVLQNDEKQDKAKDNKQDKASR